MATDAEVKEILSGPFTIEPLKLSPEAAKAFVEALDNPPAPNEALKLAAIRARALSAKMAEEIPYIPTFNIPMED